VQQSLGVSKTFKPFNSAQKLTEIVTAMATEVFERIRSSELMARTMTLETKTVAYEVKQRS